MSGAVLGALTALAGTPLAGCVSRRERAAAPEGAYSRLPEMMALGDSMYQGVRSMSLIPGMKGGSPPALVAKALSVKNFVSPEPKRPILWDLEAEFRYPLLTAGALMGLHKIDVNYGRWTNGEPWSEHEAFDNLAIGGAKIDSLWKDTYADSMEKQRAAFARMQSEFAAVSAAADLWFALNTCYTLNPLHRGEQAKRSPLDQVADRKPRLLLINVGSNEGLFSAAFSGKVSEAQTSMARYDEGMDILARRLRDLPRNVETIVFNSLIRPRAATNLMPVRDALRSRPGEAYYEAYGPALFSDAQPISGAEMRLFDDTVKAHNASARALLEEFVGSRLVFVDMYGMSDALDGKHHAGRGLKIGSQTLQNLPLRSRKRRITQGGLTGLDNLHPTVPGYAVMADADLAAIGSPGRTDKQAALRADTLLEGPPFFLNRHARRIVDVYAALQRLGENGAAATPERIEERRHVT